MKTLNYGRLLLLVFFIPILSKASQQSIEPLTKREVNEITLAPVYSGTIKYDEDDGFSRLNSVIRAGDTYLLGDPIYRGYAKYDISSIPPGSKIRSIIVECWTTTDSWSSNHRLFINEILIDPETSTESSLFNEIKSGQSFSSASRAMVDKSPPADSIYLDFTARTKLERRLAENRGWWALGFWEEDDNTDYGEFAGSKTKCIIEYTPPEIFLTSPTGGELFESPGLCEIRWTSNFSDNSFIQIEYTSDGENYHHIADVLMNDRSYRWSIPGGIKSTTCKIKITNKHFPQCNDESNHFFSIGKTRRYIAAQIPQDVDEPKIDGHFNDKAWSTVNGTEALLKGGSATPAWGQPWSDFEDIIVTWSALWSAKTNKLYVAVDIEDNVAGANDHPVEWEWKDDAVQIFIDGNHDGGANNNSFENAQQWFIGRDNDQHLVYSTEAYMSSELETAVKHQQQSNWTVEMAIEIYDKFPSLRRQLGIGDVIGWDIWYSDSDNELQEDGLWVGDNLIGWGFSGEAFWNADFLHEIEMGPSNSSDIVDNQFSDREIPKKFMLKQNYPNPFNSTTTIQYNLSELADVKITIFNATGQVIRTLSQGEQQPDVQQLDWDGKNEQGDLVASGIYYYQIQAGDFHDTKKMLLVK